ncbi:MAG: hypothetical protein KKF30_07460 [Proteobacteria bacterium]|nr:hypothetical protein [Pseudomonadota bacterium]MBU4470295.1 hypothetical protein [Pseudomonadota bacterium]MCG2752708.1 hypothetical protein [Desulfobacteraceae bacterium]
MALIDMKLTKSEKKKRLIDYPISIREKKSKGPEYPWGLDVNLEKEQIDKLGLDLRKLKVGDEIPVDAVLKIRSLSESEGESGKSQNLSLQMIKLVVKKKG